jgi:hypothetical protein
LRLLEALATCVPATGEPDWRISHPRTIDVCAKTVHGITLLRAKPTGEVRFSFVTMIRGAWA